MSEPSLRAEKIGLGWSRDEIVDRIARIIRNGLGPDFWEAPPPEWAITAAETIWQNVEAIVRDRLETDRADIKRLRALLAATPAADPGLDAAWTSLMAEARAFEEWYLPTRMGVNAWVGVDTGSGLYGGWSVEGDPLLDDWDESVMTTAEGPTVEAVIADLIKIAREYRQRRDEENAAILDEEYARVPASEEERR